jgi:hypothetical protein
VEEKEKKEDEREEKEATLRRLRRLDDFNDSKSEDSDHHLMTTGEGGSAVGFERMCVLNGCTRLWGQSIALPVLLACLFPI